MTTVREMKEADHIMGTHPAERGGPDPDCGLCPKAYECDGCGREYHDERVMVACFETHACYYCGGSVSYREHHILTPGTGMLWCGCEEG